MRTLCAYTNAKLSLDTLKSFGDFYPFVEMVNVSGDWSGKDTLHRSNTAYWHAFRDRWNGEEPLMVFSQKTPIQKHTVPSLLECQSGKNRRLLCHKDGVTLYSEDLQLRVPHRDIGGEYMVWWSVNPRLDMLWNLHQIPRHEH